MASWKERIEEAFRDRDRGKIDQGSRGVRMSNEQSPLNNEFERYQRAKENAENNLLRSGAYELLEKVRKDVWKTGSIVKKRLDEGATVSLQTSYRKVIITDSSYRTVGGSDGGQEYVPGGERRIKKFTDNITISSSNTLAVITFPQTQDLYMFMQVILCLLVQV